MSNGINSQYDFFKKICLDDNGLLCGIEGISNGLYKLNVQFEELSKALSGNTCCNEIIINNNIGGTTKKKVVRYSCNNSVCKPKVINNFIPTPRFFKKITYQPIRCGNEVLTILNINGFAVVTTSRYPRPMNPSKAIKIPRKDTVLIQERDSNGHIKPTEVLKKGLPKLKIPFGYVYPDGTKTPVIPEAYIDSKGKLKRPPQHMVGSKNWSASWKLPEYQQYLNK